ncbi:hypothetical protein JVX90_00170 [Gordonia sp. PDNC005]|uniref:hypothetical protein n=1 Tax=Gordonia sp. PDNC005 TaxID=2811424 RepID=UPI001965BAC0|nr:hypothetical protein [Gordonia sp. PDNC005]QRY62727.1 hypothetical protein JVX90_00170 [Gordonia sp. PDNC005]
MSAELMRDRCAFTSRDMAEHWGDAFTYAIVFGWGDGEGDEDDAWNEVANQQEWDQPLVEFLRDAHRRFAALGKATS